jgi:hypothetical protein
MINANVKIFNEEYVHSLESSVNNFLKTIDVRQIIKIKLIPVFLLQITKQ